MGEQNGDTARGLHLINDSFTLITSCHYTVCFFYFVPFNICQETVKNQTKFKEKKKKNQSCHNCEKFDKCLIHTCQYTHSQMIYGRPNYIVYIHATVSVTSPAVSQTSKQSILLACLCNLSVGGKYVNAEPLIF